MLALRLGTTIARLKLKGIDGDLHKQWSMWFKSTIRAKPYQFLNNLLQVLHGCRQSVLWSVWFTPINGRNFYEFFNLNYWGYLIGRKTTSSPHDPNKLGYFHVLQWFFQLETMLWNKVNLELKSCTNCFLKLENMKLELLVIVN